MESLVDCIIEYGFDIDLSGTLESPSDCLEAEIRNRLDPFTTKPKEILRLTNPGKVVCEDLSGLSYV